MLEAVDAGKARSLISRLHGARAILFLDDASNSADVLNIFTEQANVIVVAADRHFNIETATHLFDRSKFDIQDISDLSDDDVREIYNSIPQHIRQRQLSIPKMVGGRSPSLYELNSANTHELKLAERFAQGVHQMEERDEEAHDLFVMMCYVHSCRTPVSFDMAWAFQEVGHYTEVYGQIEKLGALLSEYGPGGAAILDDAQDYYNPRSVYVAEAVLASCSSRAFRRVFSRFHRNVSSYRIAQFEVFRRFGYDASFAKRAFPEWEDGIKFYDDFLKEMGATICYSKRQFIFRSSKDIKKPL